jgi:EAL domain-containing protein (putative c-di-GMP-specific phosphodiesterase class I)/ActR/RegA family two-component response regulator
MPDPESKVAEREIAVLLVEDDEVLLAGLARQLALPGVRVVVASSGQAAVQALTLQAFDVMVSDIQMPGMSGLKLLRAVRDRDLDIPVILMTGRPDLRGAAAAVEYGAFQYLIKPIQVERLHLMVQQAASIGRLGRLQREFSDSLGDEVLPLGDRAGIESALDKALGSLWMVYQPIVRAKTGEVFGREAFLRVEQPFLARPRLVLNAAERLHRLQDVGRKVRDLVAADVERVSSDSRPFFVNVHCEDLLDPLLYLPTARLGGMAKRIVLELTERGAFDRVEHLPERLTRLRELGFRVALDDMGTGSAGAGLFKSLDPEFVKLDISLVSGIERDVARQKIVRSMVRVCHDLGKQLIAEGVETSGEQAALQEFGCDFLQGYLFGRPGLLSDEASSHGGGVL